MQGDDSGRRPAPQSAGGNDPAIDEVFDRFARRLVALARAKMDGQTRQKVDPEDVVQSVFRTFFTRQAKGQFTVADWDDLWSLLVKITVRKCNRKAVAFRAARRDVRREIRLPEIASDVIDREPAPDEVACLSDTIEQLLQGANDVEREIILLRFQGFSPLEISEKIGRISERKVYRVLAQARKRLEAEDDD